MLEQWCQRGPACAIKVVLSNKVVLVPATGHHDGQSTDLYGTVASSVSDIERPRASSRSIDRDPLRCIAVTSSDQQYGIICCGAAVVIPPVQGALQVLPRNIPINITGTRSTSDQLVGDKVHSWCLYVPWVVFQDAGSLWVSG